MTPTHYRGTTRERMKTGIALIFLLEKLSVLCADVMSRMIQDSILFKMLQADIERKFKQN